jgi:hypothetical protein
MPEILEDRMVLSASIPLGATNRKQPPGGNRRRDLRPLLENLEGRDLPSVTIAAVSVPRPTFILHDVRPATVPAGVGFTPDQLRTAYGINGITFQNSTITGDASGQTIAITDYYNQPSIFGDLDAFDQSTFLSAADKSNGVSIYSRNGAATSFLTVYDQNGNVINPSTETSVPNAPKGQWGVEISLDVEWAHSIAPGAKIDLVECATNLFSGTVTAAGLQGVSAVSMSWGGGEFSGETSFDSDFAHPGVTFLAATGDTGAPGGYPAYSTNVVAVGGTSLALNGNNTWASETGWSGSGGGTSQFESEPAYQNSVQTTGFRTIPDIAMDADPNTGVAVYDSYDFGASTPWVGVGGTSLATPCWAGLIGIVNQGRAVSGTALLNATSSTQTQTLLYNLPSSDFHDNLGGSNGSSNTGITNPAIYNTTTGLGSPVASTLVPDLAAAGTLVTATGFSISASSPQTSGTPFSITVTAVDGFNRPFPGYVGTVHFTSSDGTALLPADYTFVAGDAGIHTFSNGVTLKSAGGQTITATDTTTASITGNAAVTVNPSHFNITSPANQTAGVSFSVTVTALDANNNVASNYAQTVHFTSTDPAAGLPANYTFVTADHGVHTFTVTLKTAGSQTVTATDTVTGSVTGTSAAINVTPAAAASLAVTGYIATTTAGVSHNFTVTAKDAFGNVATGYLGTVSFTSSDAAAVLPANYTFVAADAGVHVFAATFDTAGTQSITSKDTVTGTITGTQSNITVIAGLASHFVVVAVTPQTAGIAFSVTVKAEDPHGNIATSYTGTVHFASSDPAAVLPGDYTFVSADAGQHTFSNGVTLETVGSRTVRATDTVTGTITGLATVTVNPGAATHVVLAAPASSTAGTAFSLTVTALDAFGNTATGYRGAVHFTSSDAAALLPANYTFTATDAGVHTFTNGVTLKTAGSRTVTATDTVTGTITGSATVTVNPAAVNKFLLAAPASSVAGTAFSITVTVTDAFGNTEPGYLGTVHFTSTDAAALLPVNYTFVAGDAGVHTFTNAVTLKTAGNRTMTATDTVTATITGSATVSVTPGTATHVVVTAPASIAAGTAFNVTVTAQDAFNNTATGYLGTVHFTSSDATAIVPADYTFLAADAGVHLFTGGVTLKSAGSQTVTATDTVTGTITGLATVNVNPSHFTISGPGSTTAGVLFSITVTALDANNNVASSYRGTVHFTSTDAAAVLPANYTFVAGDAGVHTFNVTLKTAGSRTVTATDTGTATITGLATVSVNPAAATHVLVTAPSSITAGTAFAVTLTALDAFNNTATGYLGTVHFTSSDAAATLPANYQFMAADAGVHTFTNGVTLVTSGSRTVTATDTVTGTITGSATVTVNPGTATHVTFTAPASSVAGTAFTITLTARDAFNNTATGYRGTVQFASSDATALLPANYTFTATDSGVHTFTNGVTLKAAGSQTVTATDTVTGTITGNATVNVSPSHFSISAPGASTAGVSFSITVTALDANNNVAVSYLGTVHFTSSDGQALLPANYPFVAGDAGVHTFTVTLNTAGNRTVTATDTVTAAITGLATVTVSPAAVSKFLVTAPASSVAGTAFSLTVTAADAFGNTVPSYLGTVHFTSSDTTATLPANYTFLAGDAGVHTFTAGVTLNSAGSQTVTATDTVTATVTGSTTVSVSPSHFSISGPSSTTAGVLFSITVTALDANNNVASSYRGTVHFTSTDAAAVLPVNYTFVAGDAGVHALNVTLKTAGSRTVTATDTVTATITGLATVSVNPASASKFLVTAPASSAAGTAFTVTLTAQDAFNNTATGYLGTVHFTSSDTAATLPANYPFVAGDAGVHTFTNGVTLVTAGSRTVTATDTVTATITGLAVVSVTPGTATHLTFTAPASSVAGTAFTITATARDAFNNTATGYRGTVHFTSSDATALLPANYTFTATDSGVHTFTNGVTLKTAGSQTVTATDTVTGTITGSATVTVNPGPTAHFSLAAPSSVAAGTAFTITVTALDAFGNTATGYRGTVHFTSSDASAVLPANYTVTAADAGVHAFTNGATLNTAGNQTITATDTVNSTITGSTTITVNSAIRLGNSDVMAQSLGSRNPNEVTASRVVADLPYWLFFGGARKRQIVDDLFAAM